MSEKTSLQALLGGNSSNLPSLDIVQADGLKRAASFWLGNKVATRMRKGELAPALKSLFQDRERLREALGNFSDEQRQVLAIIRSYGGAISGRLLQAELRSRGLEEDSDPIANAPYVRPDRGPVFDLMDKLVLVPGDGRGRYQYMAYGYGVSLFGGYHRPALYPDVMMVPALVPLIEPSPVLPWSAPASIEVPTSYRRSAAAAILELGTVAQALTQLGTWKTIRGGAAAKSTQNRIDKLLTVDSADELRPPDVATLWYEILRGESVIQIEADHGSINSTRLVHFLSRSAARQSREIVRAWLQARLWEDGIGQLGARDSDYDVGYGLIGLGEARALLVWGLVRLAQSPPAWAHLETFLNGLCDARSKFSASNLYLEYQWVPNFKATRDKSKHRGFGSSSPLADWLISEGTLIANALMSTFVYLGLVERSADLTCFRLTETGHDVFSGSAQTEKSTPVDTKFLSVQPNHDVLVYVEEADPSKIFTLARMARRTTTGNDPVQTFVLTRESVYQGLESGLTTEQMREFLLQASKTGLPNNVAHSLNEWGRKRDSLVLRSGVTLLAVPPGQESRLPSVATGRRVGDRFLLVAPTERQGFKGQKRDHAMFAPPGWKIEEDGLVRAEADADSATLARLEQLTEPAEQGRKITAASIRRARERGIAAEQALGWLRAHAVGGLPPIMETAIRNWFSAGRINLGNLLLLQVPQAQACQAILASERFRAHFLSHVPPHWFIVRANQKAELSDLLREFGFVLDDEFQMEELPKVVLDENVAPKPTKRPAPARKKSRTKRWS
jgi:hypothetical protein